MRTFFGVQLARWQPKECVCVCVCVVLDFDWIGYICVCVRIINLTKGYGADSVSMPGWPGIEQIVAQRSAGGHPSLPRQEVLSPLLEGRVAVVEGACEMIKKNTEEKHRFWMERDRPSAGSDWMNRMQWVEGRQKRGWTEREKAQMTWLSVIAELQ